MRILRKFVRQNKWRLHDLFARSGITYDYRLPVEAAARLLEPVGGLVPFNQAL